VKILVVLDECARKKECKKEEGRMKERKKEIE
jgi:hypothetical protein